MVARAGNKGTFKFYQLPSLKRDSTEVKLFFRSDVKTTIDKDGCLVVIKRNKKSLVTRTLLVMPDSVSLGLLYSLHINLYHPTKDQLFQAVGTRFSHKIWPISVKE